MEIVGKKKLADYLEQFAKKELVVIGDLMLDKYLRGEVERISPEAPVPVLHVKQESDCLGGSGNVINNLVALGAKVRAVSVVGDDPAGKLICKKLEAKGIDTSPVFIANGRLTPLKTRLVASHQQVVRYDIEDVVPITENYEDKIISYLSSVITEVDGVILSDYLKGVLTARVLKESISICRQHKRPVIIDPKGEDYKKYTGATILTPNLKETRGAARTKINTDDELKAAGKKLLASLKLDALLVTMGEKGMTLFKARTKPFAIPTVAREVFDVTGAGDTVVALMGLGVVSGASFKEAAAIANLAAGVVVGKLGASTVTKEEVLRYHDEVYYGTDIKLLSQAELTRVVTGLQAQGKKCVFANGCFDLLHVGHITFLKKAKKLGDILIVGLNSDCSIKRIKGKHRPIIPEHEREHILSSLEVVDFVVRFDEDTPEELIRKLKPDIIVKGSNYRMEEIVGREIVSSYGGEVKLIEYMEGISTSRLIKKIGSIT